MSSNPNAKIALAREKHSRQRQWRLEGGRIDSADGWFSLPCTIVDMTPDGARVRVDEALNMPARVNLLDTRERSRYAANLIWSKPPEYGLQFMDKFPSK